MSTRDEVLAATGTTAPAALALREGQEFADLVAGLVPCRHKDPQLWFVEQFGQANGQRPVRAGAATLLLRSGWPETRPQTTEEALSCTSSRRTTITPMR